MREMDIHEIIEELVDNNDDAYGVCLFLYMNEDYYALNNLHYLDIKGDDLVTFFYKCCPIHELNFIDQSVRFLLSGFLGQQEIKDNLKSENPQQFIPRLLIKGEDWDFAYENFAGDFRVKSTPKKR